jgi:hypothetical protein
MSGPGDPPEGPITTPELPDFEPPSVPVPVIEAGRAQEAFGAALGDLVDAYRRLDATGMAIARALDAAAKPDTSHG